MGLIRDLGLGLFLCHAGLHLILSLQTGIVHRSLHIFAVKLSHLIASLKGRIGIKAVFREHFQSSLCGPSYRGIIFRRTGIGCHSLGISLVQGTVLHRQITAVHRKIQILLLLGQPFQKYGRCILMGTVALCNRESGPLDHGAQVPSRKQGYGRTLLSIR